MAPAPELDQAARMRQQTEADEALARSLGQAQEVGSGGEDAQWSLKDILWRGRRVKIITQVHSFSLASRLAV